MENFLDIINKFILKMGYTNNSHFLGIYFYGSSLTGFNNKESDIDLHVIFDNSDFKHIFRGVCYIDGIRIEYFEKCISDVYLSVKNDIKLQEYTLDVYKNINGIDEEDIYEKISIINNRMSKLKKCLEQDSSNFYSLFYITVEKIRRFYHSIHGFPKINTSKIYRIYKDDEYSKSYFPNEFVSDEFKKLYFSLIETDSRDKKELYEKLDKFYKYVLDGRCLPREFKIHIKSRND